MSCTEYRGRRLPLAWSALVVIVGLGSGCESREGVVARCHARPGQVTTAFPPVCADSGWCLTNPPRGLTFSAVWGSSPSQVWALAAGSPLFWDGSRWAFVQAPLGGLLHLWGSGPDDVWFVGSGRVAMHWDGSQFSVIGGSTVGWALTAVGGTGPDDVWFVQLTTDAGGGVAHHWDGQGLAQYPLTERGAAVASLWAVAPDDVWAVTDRQFHHWNGSIWSVLGTEAEGRLRALWGASATDIWAVGDLGLIMHWNGKAWSRVDSGTDRLLYAVWGTDSNQVWATGEGGIVLRWNGREWSLMREPTVETYLGIWGCDSDALWAVGDGNFSVWNGLGWTDAASTPFDTLGSMWGSGRSDVWAVGEGGRAMHWDGDGWAQVPTGTSQPLAKVWGVAPDAVWAVGPQSTLLRWDGAAWSEFEKPPVPGTYAAITGSSRDDLWMALRGTRRTFHWNGTGWSDGPVVPIAVPPASPTEGTLTDLWSGDRSTVWGAGTDFLIISGDGSSWTRWGGDRERYPVGYFAVWGASPEDVWMAGTRLTHWTAGNGFASDLSSDRRWTGISGSSASDVWFVGGPDVGHWDGSTLSFGHFDLPVSINAVWAVGPGEAWAVGAKGVILHHAP